MTLGPVSPGPHLTPQGGGGGTDSASIPLAAPQTHPVSQGLLEEPAFRAGVIDGFFAVLLCGLAFLLASTPSRNSDLWLHLASGRALSGGRLPDGTDPFSSTTQGVYWVNHTWLSDVFLFQLYNLGDGAALVVGETILVLLVAVLLCCFRRPGERMGMLGPAGFAAMLALGPWLVLQPILLSLFGVLLTVYLLERPGQLAGDATEKARRRRWLLVPFFALWANLDGWYVLGPVLVGLYALGEILRRLTAPAHAEHANDLRSLVLLTLAGWAACLATPYHYHIFAWPPPLGLTATEKALRDDPLGQTLVLSPFGARFAASPVLRSPGAWAYYLLLASSAGSFIPALRRVHPGRLLAWLVLAALSIYQARTIPFFAVVAAAFLALNVREWSRGSPVSETRQRLRFAADRVGVLVGIALLVLAWPGWLQPAPYQPRGWSVEPDGSLVRMAEHLKRYHAQSRFRPDRFAFTFSPEVAHYLAWFCPEEKGFLDSRWPLFDRVAEDYAAMRNCLLWGEGDAISDLSASLIIINHDIDRILLHDTDWERTARAYRYLFHAPDWELLAVAGGATLFIHRTGAAASPDAFDVRRAAYHLGAEQHAPPAPRPPRPPGWFDAFRPHPESRSADREEAALYLLTFDLQAEQQQTRLVRQWLLAQAAGLIGCGLTTEPAATAGTLALRLDLTPLLPSDASNTAAPASSPGTAAEQFATMYLTSQGGGPPEPLYLAVRAARRALAVNPDDARAFCSWAKPTFDSPARHANRTGRPCSPTSPRFARPRS